MKYQSLVLDIGDVLLHYSLVNKLDINLKAITNNVLWYDFERGTISESDCYEKIAKSLNIKASQIKQGFDVARKSLCPNPHLLSMIASLKKKHNLRVYGMTNISAPDYQYIRREVAGFDWSIFDKVFTSADAGTRKPDLMFYELVIQQTGIDPASTIFIDDKLENVVSARAKGMTGICMPTIADGKEVERKLYNLLEDPVERGRKYLKTFAKKHESVTQDGVVVFENWTQFLIQEATGDCSLVDVIKWPSDLKIPFFKSLGQLGYATFPKDQDTTSLGMSVTIFEHEDSRKKKQIMDEMLTYHNQDGILLNYFDRSAPRFDPGAVCNIITFFCTNNRGHEVQKSLDWVVAVLQSRAYVEWTHYYSPDVYLFFFARMLSESQEIRQRWSPLLAERVQERIKCSGSAVDLAARIVAGREVGIENTWDAAALREMQDIDGGWPYAALYKIPSRKITVGNRGFTTALAVKALMSNGNEFRIRGKPVFWRNNVSARL